ncbi:transposase [Nostoc sp. CHAB 5836]|uniref:RNA-guided endonuclease InsQ/TnpB family protein n=1 Tax=Nostoc sp. CHAB 5836 TaxID=2780404 RepID=UPI001E56D8E8|nr:transposase [Nostoc sp. CHAB 5836]MCC5616237.1 transposase [Nostoc sp. CHAB 5836]
MNHYILEVVYNVLVISENKLDKTKVAGVDLGLSNLAAITSNIEDFQPIIVNGNPLKSINQYFNKVKAKFQSIVKKGSTKKIQKLSTKRNLKVDDYLHKASRFVVNHLIAHGIGTLVIGKNDTWKQDLNIGKRNNQNFTQIPHERFVHQLKYKAELAGMKVILTEEFYTSKASFLDLDIIPTYKKGIQHTFSGKRIQRGLYKSKSGKLINADVSGSYNIIKKAIPNAFSNGIEGVVVHPVRLNLQTS